LWNKAIEGSYDSATELARDISKDTKTVIAMLNKGIFQVLKHRKQQRYRIRNITEQQIEDLKRKPYQNHYKRWSVAENYVLINFRDKPDKVLAKMLKRNENSIRIQRCKLKKHGIYA